MLANSSGGDCNGHSTTTTTAATTSSQGLSHRDRLRKARRLSRDASAIDDAEKDAPPCTDFDVAYFQSYSHLGIHEEMIKVSLFYFIFYFINHHYSLQITNVNLQLTLIYGEMRTNCAIFCL